MITNEFINASAAEAQEQAPNPRAKQLPYRYDGIVKVTGKAKYAG